ncbi:MAG: hypothetical protein QOI09_27, partial [Chloroflexota bacterium]|nr:hypothetical protein [Chloroflexota bacterium]
MDRSLTASDQEPTAIGLVGRMEELAEIDRFLDRSQTRLHGLLLSGQAGIGKTTLWKSALTRAGERGFRVLACRPTEIETQLSFASLVDLLVEVADEFLPQLPEAQRSAVEAALLRGTADAATTPLGVSLGVLGILRAAAETRPLLIAIDDVPWLDDSSARALAFALRRLEDSPIGLLAAQRTDGNRRAVPELVAAVGPDRHSAIDVAPLTVDETAEVIQRVVGLTLRRPALVRVHELSGGNAFYALEIARAIQRRNDPAGHDELHIPESLEDLIRDRIDALPAASAEVALHAAALSQPTREVLAAALGADAAETGLTAAVAAGVLDAEGEAIRFSHPLLAAAIYGRSSAATRQSVHRTLAAAVREPEERARHLAVATQEPDATIATTLEEAARTARARGAAGAAAELAEAAIRLTPAGQFVAGRRRTMAAAAYHVAAGDVPRARATLESLAAETPEAERGAILVELGHLLLNLSDRPAAGSVLERALPLVGSDL